MFFITCFSKVDKDDLGWLDMGTSRTFGFKETFEEAEYALNLYDYAIVEEMHPAIHPTVENRWFYKYDREKNGFFRMEEPKEFTHYSNIALG